ncbi:hypothetical protein LIA77_06407 [Sarocladium implicatum]|nr:hypothetical protein LIA77_06407 [Sarocladium implicatum]
MAGGGMTHCKGPRWIEQQRFSKDFEGKRDGSEVEQETGQTRCKDVPKGYRRESQLWKTVLLELKFALQ